MPNIYGIPVHSDQTTDYRAPESNLFWWVDILPLALGIVAIWLIVATLIWF